MSGSFWGQRGLGVESWGGGDRPGAVADFRHAPISKGIGISFKFLRNHTAIQQRQLASYQASLKALL